MATQEALRRGRVRQLRRAHAQAIALNPRSFTFTRTTYVDNAIGEADRVVTTIGPFTCRLYQDRYARETVTNPLGAPVQAGQRWGLQAPVEAELYGDPDRGDEFTCPEGYFRVREVFRHALGPDPSHTWGYECDVLRLA